METVEDDNHPKIYLFDLSDFKIQKVITKLLEEHFHLHSKGPSENNSCFFWKYEEYKASSNICILFYFEVVSEVSMHYEKAIQEVINNLTNSLSFPKVLLVVLEFSSSFIEQSL